jgi:hypothetical protein
VSKTAAAVLVFVALTLLSIPMSAQLLPDGNVYAGYSYGQLTNVTNTQSYSRGFNASVEMFPFSRIQHIGFVLDGSGFYRRGVGGFSVTQYNAFLGPRFSTNYGKWRPFAQAMAGIKHVDSSGNEYNPLTIDIGGGADYRLPFHSFSWRVQADYMHSRYLSATQNDYRASTGIVWRF